MFKRGQFTGKDNNENSKDYFKHATYKKEDFSLEKNSRHKSYNFKEFRSTVNISTWLYETNHHNFVPPCVGCLLRVLCEGNGHCMWAGYKSFMWCMVGGWSEFFLGIYNKNRVQWEGVGLLSVMFDCHQMLDTVGWWIGYKVLCSIPFIFSVCLPHTEEKLHK